MKETVVEQRTVFPHAFQPPSNSGFTVTRAAHEDRDIAPFSQEHQDQNDMPIISLQSIQGSVKATGEALVTPLTFPILNIFMYTAFSIANNGVQQVIDDTEVNAQGIGASVALGCEMFGAATRTFALGVGNDIRVWLQHSQFDTRLAAWAVFGRSGFPFSGTIALCLLTETLENVIESVPQREEQGERECKDDDVFDAKSGIVHRKGRISGKMGMIFRFYANENCCQYGEELFELSVITIGCTSVIHEMRIATARYIFNSRSKKNLLRYTKQ